MYVKTAYGCGRVAVEDVATAVVAIPPVAIMFVVPPDKSVAAAPPVALQIGVAMGFVVPPDKTVVMALVALRINAATAFVATKDVVVIQVIPIIVAMIIKLAVTVIVANQTRYVVTMGHVRCHANCMN